MARNDQKCEIDHTTPPQMHQNEIYEHSKCTQTEIQKTTSEKTAQTNETLIQMPLQMQNTTDTNENSPIGQTVMERYTKNTLRTMSKEKLREIAQQKNVQVENEHGKRMTRANYIDAILLNQDPSFALPMLPTTMTEFGQSMSVDVYSQEDVSRVRQLIQTLAARGPLTIHISLQMASARENGAMASHQNSIASNTPIENFGGALPIAESDLVTTNSFTNRLPGETPSILDCEIPSPSKKRSRFGGDRADMTTMHSGSAGEENSVQHRKSFTIEQKLQMIRQKDEMHHTTKKIASDFDARPGTVTKILRNKRSILAQASRMSDMARSTVKRIRLVRTVLVPADSLNDSDVKL